MPSVEVSAKPKPVVKAPSVTTWSQLGLVCLLLAVSGGIRSVRDLKFSGLVKESENPPFPLTEFPKNLGTWHAVEGSESALEPEFALIAGAKESVIREYVDAKTHQKAAVMILYGLASIVWPHCPSACYPAQGFKRVSPLRDREVRISVPESTVSARFLEEHFTKAIAGQVNYRVVYHSFLNAGCWDFDVQKKWKSFRYHPGMFRVQVQRLVDSGSGSDERLRRPLIEHRPGDRSSFASTPRKVMRTPKR